MHLQKYYRSSTGVHIWTENNKDGKGATFDFSLPVVIDEF